MRITTVFCAAAVTLGVAAVFAAPANPDRDMKKVLKELEAKGGKPIESLSAAEARTQPTPADAVKSLMKSENISAESKQVDVKDIQVQGAVGMIAARTYTPAGKKPLPIVVYYHGGGFVIATNDVYDATPRALSEQTGAIFVSVEYRKGPESKFPAAHDDAFAAYKWVLENAASLGGDPKHVAVAGESAGGNLALNVAIRARDEKVQLPSHELLIYPVASTDMNSESYKKNADAKPLNKPMMAWFMKNYTSSEAEAKDPRLNLVAADLKGVSPATIITAEIDPLRSEGKLLAERLQAAGVKVDYKDYTGVTHEFFGMAAVVNDAKAAQKFASKQLKDSLH